jgi:hypothetical protein
VNRSWSVTLVVVGASVALAGTFMPWLTSGSVDRSSYDLLDLLDRLGFASGGAMDAALTVWPVVPLLLVVSIVAALVPRVPPVVDVALWTPTGLYVGVVSVGVLAAPGATLLRVRFGVWVSVIGALLVLAGTVVEAARVVRSDRSTDRVH